jgi:hypothetical protein
MFFGFPLLEILETKVLSEWISTKDLASFDIAICNHSLRRNYLSLGWKRNGKKKSKSKNLINISF